MKKNSARTSGYDKEHLRRLKYASVESKLYALTQMIDLTNEAQKNRKRQRKNI